MKVINFIVQHNLSLGLFADLVELAIDLGATRLRKLNAGKNATHISSKIVVGLQPTPTQRQWQGLIAIRLS